MDMATQIIIKIQEFTIISKHTIALQCLINFMIKQQTPTSPTITHQGHHNRAIQTHLAQ